MKVPPRKPNVIRSNAAVVRGTPGDDLIIGGNASQKILGGGGNDIIIGGGGSDIIHGGKGNDRMRGGRGNDKLRGGGGRDRLAGEIGDDHLSGDGRRDHLAGGMGIDILKGGTGADVLRGDAGPDFMDGGLGKDTASFVTQPAGSGGVDVDARRPSPWQSSFEGTKYPGSSLGGSRAGGGSGVDGLKGIENVVGSASPDRANGFEHFEEGPNAANRIDVFRSKLTGGTTITLTGGDGNDRFSVRQKGKDLFITDGETTRRIRINGPIDAIQIDGGKGNDVLSVKGLKNREIAVTLSGGEGNDKLVGGSGNDTLNDGAGKDVLIGGGGDDGLTNGAGRDTLRGGAGNDLLVSSSVDRGDLLDGGTGEDNVSFAQVGDAFAVRARMNGLVNGKARIVNAEDLEGTERDDVLIGDGGDNKLLGRGGADTLIGGAGDDRLDALYRGDEDKLLDGGDGNDTATVDPKDVQRLRNVEKKRRRTAVI